eukprot:CAMPEP_0115005760 /NCGR_PEP_ID=MMETSP0216-20121206/20082_1 /TAXON_ID=223996 /ORGANISM="Protocruzia adherens, Strain Boccale" /LENGTH=35 /DNA_ID= /DNA_START= /DNA_END= /DNA_ORIENTATION=
MECAEPRVGFPTVPAEFLLTELSRAEIESLDEESN